MFTGYQGRVELAPFVDKKVNKQRNEDDEAFVLELEDYLDNNKCGILNSDYINNTDDVISQDISKMSMKGYADDPYLSHINKDNIGSYQSSQNDILTPLQASVTSFLGSTGSEGSNYWSSSPENSVAEETNNSGSTYFLLPNSYESFQLSYDVNLSATADQIIAPSSSLHEDPVKSSKMFETKKGKYKIIFAINLRTIKEFVPRYCKA